MEPYWLQTNLCNDKQSDWWYNCYNFLFNRKKRLSQNGKPIEQLEDIRHFNLDIKKQTEYAKILELLRLKHGNIKIANNSTKEIEIFQINLNIVVLVAKYFQSLVDKFKTSKHEYPKEAHYLCENPDLSSMLNKSLILIDKFSDNP
jgi:hypothetical protein